MPFVRPTLRQLHDTATAHIRAHLPGSDPLLQRSNLRAIAEVTAGAAHLQYGYLAWLARQIMADTAEVAHLDRHAAIWGVNRKGALAAAGTVDFSGLDAAAIPVGTVLQSGDATAYVTTAAGAIAAGTAAVPLAALLPGAAGNLAAGVSLALVSPVAGIDATALVAAGGLTGGEDIESDERLRGRLLDRIQKPPQGGAAHDYRAWALEVAEVTRAWVFPNEQGLGTVVVRFLVDDDPLGPIPAAPKVAEVQAHIDPLRPVTAAVSVLAPIAVPLDLTVALVPNTAAVQAAVQAAVKDLLRREAAPGATILLSHIREAISIAAGETDHQLTAPAADVTHQAGEVAVAGVITWL